MAGNLDLLMTNKAGTAIGPETQSAWLRPHPLGFRKLLKWLSDRYGVTWQIVPRQLPVMLRDSDAARVMRVIQAMTPMVKLDLAVLTAAYLGA